MERATDSQEKDFEKFMSDLRQQVEARYGSARDACQTIEVIADARVLEVLARHHTNEAKP